MWLLVLLIIALCVFLFYKVRSKFKFLSPLGTITCTTGAVKTGKSTLAVHLAMKSYKKELKAWKLKSIFDHSLPKPLLYSNIPLNCEYVPVTTDILLRKVRIVPRSVMLLDEASLVADSQLIRDNTINTNLLAFFKLYGHSTHGGSLILDTQSLTDLHYNIRRALGKATYIYRSRSVPFFIIMDVIEQRYADDGTVVSSQSSDIEDNLRHVIVPKRTWRMFDTYCYSILTDSLPIYDKVVDGSVNTLKTVHIPSFRKWDIK